MSEELINEAREFLATPNLGKSMMLEPNKAMIYIRRLAASLEVAMVPHAECEASGERAGAQLADLKAALEASEARVKELEAGVEWEYGLRTRSKSDPVRGFFSYAGDFETAWEMHGATYEHCTATIVRRRKAGPWVPVESEVE